MLLHIEALNEHEWQEIAHELLTKTNKVFADCKEGDELSLFLSEITTEQMTEYLHNMQSLLTIQFLTGITKPRLV